MKNPVATRFPSKPSRCHRARSQKPEARIRAYKVSRSPSRSFQDLIVWRKAHDFVLGVYRASASFPKNETFGLTSQLRRAAVSVPANIAEGFVKRGKPDKARLMNVAQGSLEEARYYLILANDLGYV